MTTSRSIHGTGRVRRQGGRPVLLFSLLASGVAAAQAPAPVVALNHLYVYVDSASYDALAASPWLRDTLGAVRQATISDTRGSWSGLYLFGRTTYLEFYRAGPGTPPPGTAALAFGVDRAGDLAAVAAAAGRRGLATVLTTRRRAVGTDTVPWFDQRSPAPADSARIAPAFRWWAMEYHPSYLARRPGGGPMLEGRMDRASYNQPVFAPDLLLQDVTGVVLGLDGAARRAAVAQLVALGLGAGGEPSVLDAAGVAIALDSVPAGAVGLRIVRFRVAPEAPAGRRRFGGLELVIRDGRAELIIGPGRI